MIQKLIKEGYTLGQIFNFDKTFILKECFERSTCQRQKTNMLWDLRL